MEIEKKQSKVIRSINYIRKIFGNSKNKDLKNICDRSKQLEQNIDYNSVSIYNPCFKKEGSKQVNLNISLKFMGDIKSCTVFQLLYMQTKVDLFNEKYIDKYEALAYLVERCDIKYLNLKDSNGNTLLHYACFFNDYKFAMKIMERDDGVDISKNFLGFSPFSLFTDQKSKYKILCFQKKIRNMIREWKKCALKQKSPYQVINKEICESRQKFTEVILRNLIKRDKKEFKTLPGYLHISFVTFSGFIRNLENLNLIKVEIKSEGENGTFFAESHCSYEDFAYGKNITSIRIENVCVKIIIKIYFNEKNNSTFYPVAEFKYKTDRNYLNQHMDEIKRNDNFLINSKTVYKYDKKTRPCIEKGIFPANIFFSSSDEMSFLGYGIFKDNLQFMEFIVRRKFAYSIFYKCYINYRLTFKKKEETSCAYIWRQRFLVIEGQKINLYHNNTGKLLESIDIMYANISGGRENENIVLLEFKEAIIEIQLDDDFCYQKMIKILKMLTNWSKGYRKLIESRTNEKNFFVKFIEDYEKRRR